MHGVREIGVEHCVHFCCLHVKKGCGKSESIQIRAVGVTGGLENGLHGERVKSTIYLV